MTYLTWLTLLVWLPILVLWLTHFRLLRRYVRTVIMCIAGSLLFGLPWDFWAIQTRMWEFPSTNVVGIWIAGIPLEEYFFIIFMTLLIATITLILKYRLRNLIARN